MESNENRNAKMDETLDELLTAALKSEPVKSLPYGFAAIITRKAFAQNVRPIGIKTYGLVLIVTLGILAFSLTLLRFINPELTASIFEVIKSARYILGFSVASFFLIEYVDQKWVRA
nr:hypothetical protein [Pedobacter panaciterrae]